MYDAYHHITVHKDDAPPAGLPSRGAEKIDNTKDLITQDSVFDVVGGLCENNDKFAIDRKLSKEPDVGDVMLIHDSGAHGHSMGFNYNGKLRSAEVLAQTSGDFKLIRRGETYHDLF